MRVDQLVPAFHRGDAIGDTTLHMKNFFRSEGFSSGIYCLNHDPDLETEAVPFSAFPSPSPEDVAILHYALPSPLSGEFARMPSRKIIIYHNITPDRFFAPFSPDLARICRAGRSELASLVSVTDLALADSEFNRLELQALGFRETGVLPLFIDPAKYEKPMSALIHDLYRDGRTNILFVGRIAPNKKIEDLIRVTFYYKKYVSPLVRLLIVGKTSSLPKYYESLVRFADDFFLKPEEIQFLGHVPDCEMFALYRASDVFLSMSEHEGFCLPLIESMIFDLPVIAYDAAAVPFTMDGAGILISEKRPDRVGELVEKTAHDRTLRRTIIDGQRRRLERFRKTDLRTFLLEKIGRKSR